MPSAAVGMREVCYRTIASASAPVNTSFVQTSVDFYAGSSAYLRTRPTQLRVCLSPNQRIGVIGRDVGENAIDQTAIAADGAVLHDRRCEVYPHRRQTEDVVPNDRKGSR